MCARVRACQQSTDHVCLDPPKRDISWKIGELIMGDVMHRG